MKVTGESLSPFLQHGDYVLLACCAGTRLRAGDLIVFHHAIYGRLIKRIQVISADGDELFVVGENPASIDSRQFGLIRRAAVVGKVLFVVRRKTT